MRAAIAVARGEGLVEGDVWLIGSFASGEPRSGSDVDLVVAQCPDRIGLAAAIAASLCRDVHVMTRERAPPPHPGDAGSPGRADLSVESRAALVAAEGFRHFLRHAYAADLEPDELRRTAARLDLAVVESAPTI